MCQYINIIIIVNTTTIITTAVFVSFFAPIKVT